MKEPSQSPTPRTDAICDSILTNRQSAKIASIRLVELSLQLEHELTEAKKEIERLEKLIDSRLDSAIDGIGSDWS